MRVTVFGSSQPKPGEPEYESARKLGRRLAEAGQTVLTGGYIGTMEAVSCGAHEAGGHVIGVTCDEIESWRPVRPNRWVMEEMRFPSLRLRLFALLENCDIALALPGGIGTLAEIAMMWSHLQTGLIPARPLVLIGPGWEAVVRTMYEHMGMHVPDPYRRFLEFVPDVESAVERVKAYAVAQTS